MRPLYAWLPQDERYPLSPREITERVVPAESDSSGDAGCINIYPPDSDADVRESEVEE